MCFWILSETNDICMDQEPVVIAESAKIKAATGRELLRMANFVLNRRYLGIQLPERATYIKMYVELFRRLVSMGIIRHGNVTQKID